MARKSAMALGATVALGLAGCGRGLSGTFEDPHGLARLDFDGDGTVVQTSALGAIELRLAYEVDGDRISDLHLWQVGPGHYSAIVTIVTDHPQPPASYKASLRELKQLSHVTVEVDQCVHPDGACTHAA